MAKIHKLPNIGSCARIRKVKGDKVTPYYVEFAAMLVSGKCDNDWGIAGGSPGMVDSTFKTKKAARRLIKLDSKVRATDEDADTQLQRNIKRAKGHN